MRNELLFASARLRRAGRYFREAIDSLEAAGFTRAEGESFALREVRRLPAGLQSELGDPVHGRSEPVRE